MPFSLRYGLCVRLTMLLFLLAQVWPQCYRPRPKSPGHVIPNCCMETSNATIRETVNVCFLQEKNTFSNCKIKAYILTNENNEWCVDPRAWWLQQRLWRLKQRGICCQII